MAFAISPSIGSFLEFSTPIGGPTNSLAQQLFETFGETTDGLSVARTRLRQRPSGRVLQEMNKRNEPHLQFHWSVIMPFGFPPAYVEEVNMGFPKISVEERHHEIKKRYDPGFVDIDDISITFYEDNKGTTLDYLLKWGRRVVDGAFYGRPADYKKTIILILHDVKDNPIVVGKGIRCWPQGPEALTMGSDSSEATKVNCTFSTDDLEWETAGSNNGFVTDAGFQFDRPPDVNVDQVTRSIGIR